MRKIIGKSDLQKKKQIQFRTKEMEIRIVMRATNIIKDILDKHK